ncbi:single-strand selective monofunctional uracil DNA glycosylase-like isoform X2 [Diachasmimorpha longicaudata]
MQPNTTATVPQELHESPTLIPETIPSAIPTRILFLECFLTKALQKILFGAPVEYVYSPIEYAFSVHSNYVHKFCKDAKKILFLGMNPGPWGMSQTGVPFGEVNTVVNWLELSGNVETPPREQPDRKVQGLLCKRSEVSGRRFWELFKRLSRTPDVFFRHSFLRNYCPVALMDAGGRNITPAELKGPEYSRVIQLCDTVLGDVLKILKVEIVVGVGRFAEKRARHVVKAQKLSTQVVWIPHPSPRAAGYQDWSICAQKHLHDLDLLKFFSNEANLPPAIVIPSNSERRYPQVDGCGPFQG